MTHRETTARPAPSELVLGVAAAILLTGIAIISPGVPFLIVAAGALALALVLSFDRPEIAVVLLVAAATLDLTGRIAEIGPLKLTVYQTVVMYVAFMVVARLAYRRSRWAPTYIDLPAALFVALMIISLLDASDRGLAAVAAISMVSSVFLAYAVVILLDTPKRLTAVVLGTLGIAAVFGVLGVLERQEIFTVGSYLRIWGEGVRAKVTFKDPNIMGSFQMAAVALALPVVLTLRGAGRRTFWAGATLLAGAGLFSSGSRGAMGGFVVALAVILLLSRVGLGTKLGVLVLVIAIGVSAFAFAANPGWLENRVINVTDDSSMLARVYMGFSALEIARDNPAGVGIGNYPVHFPYYRNAAERHNLIESHTAYMTVLVEMGLLGLIAFLGVLGAGAAGAFRAARRAVDPVVHAVAVGALAASAGMAAQAFTYSLEGSKFWWLSIGVGLAALAITQAASKSPVSGEMNGATRA